MNSEVIPSLPVAALVCVAALALVLAGVLASAEVAFSRLSRAAAQDMVDEGERHAELVVDLLEHRGRVDLVLRGTRTFWQVVVAVVLTLLLVHIGWVWWVTAPLAVLLIGVLQFVTVSVVAWRAGARDPERVGRWWAPLTVRLVRVSHLADPLIRLLRARLPRPSRTEAEAREEMAEDLREMVDEVGETAGIAEEDREMIRSVFELGNTLVREVMVPRTDMVTVEADVPARKALRLFVRSGFSRIPVVGDSADEVRGVLYFKDVVQRLEAQARADEQARADGGDTSAEGGAVELVAEQMMRPAEFTVEMKPADDLLRLMQAEHFHLALVVDEYGGISGLVTLEDLLEEVVGELTDEHDRHIERPEEVAPGVWRLPRRFPIGELGDLLGLELEDEDVDSVGGLLGKAIGRVPLPGAEGELLGVRMVAEEARGRRRQVGTILCSRSDGAEESADGTEGEGRALSE